MLVAVGGSFAVVLFLLGAYMQWCIPWLYRSYNWVYDVVCVGVLVVIVLPIRFEREAIDWAKGRANSRFVAGCGSGMDGHEK